MSDLVSDLRYGARLLRRAPGFTAVAVASLALGIAGATTVFTLLNAIVLRPLPVASPGQLYLLRSETRRDHSELFSAPVFDRARAAVGSDAELCAATGVSAMQLWPDGQTSADRGAVQLVSGEYFTVLRQRPELGRLLAPSDNVDIDAHPVAVVSDAYWREHLAASPAGVGSTLRINGVAFTIVGIAEPGFFGTTVAVRNPDVWIPFRMQGAVRYNSNSSNSDGDSTKPWSPQPQISWLNVFARVPNTTAAPVIAARVSAVVQQDAVERL
ncbi:MAG TPA: ABC transporter permease, partial [Vicinamibacterales bacterium]|nr:ABC transporter permease [Vicinamibacterales bacterium]